MHPLPPCAVAGYVSHHDTHTSHSYVSTFQTELSTMRAGQHNCAVTGCPGASIACCTYMVLNAVDAVQWNAV